MFHRSMSNDMVTSECIMSIRIANNPLQVFRTKLMEKTGTNRADAKCDFASNFARRLEIALADRGEFVLFGYSEQ